MFAETLDLVFTLSSLFLKQFQQRGTHSRSFHTLLSVNCYRIVRCCIDYVILTWIMLATIELISHIL